MANENRSFRERLIHALHVIPGGSLLFALIPIAVFGYLGWYHYGAKRLDRTFYSLKPDQIQISAQPEWIKSDILDEVFKTKRLDRINTLDPSATADIASAFETHAWVKTATRVGKYGNLITVDLVYREPLALICVPHRTESGVWKEGFEPIDQHGVVLPIGDFTDSDVTDHRYVLIRIENVARTPQGMAYADIRIHQALKLANFLQSSGMRSLLGIEWILVDRDNDASSGKPWILGLETNDKRKIVWGRSPGEELPTENPADRKLSDLTNWLKSERESNSKASHLDLSTSRGGPGQTVSTAR